MPRRALPAKQFCQDLSMLPSSRVRVAEPDSVDNQTLKVERKRYHTLDGLRGVAAMFVACYHFGSRNGADFPGYLAVDLFFVLSGFVIALNYSERLRTGFTTKRFIQVRAVRLVPMYLLGFFLGILKESFGLISHNPRALRLPVLICSIPAGLFMLPSPCTRDLFPLNGPSWSLFFEIIINVLFAIWLWRARTPALLVVLACSFAVMALAVGPPMDLNKGWSWPTAHVGFVRASFSFPIGILIYRYFSRQERVTWAALVPVAVMSAALSFTPERSLVPAEQLFVVALVFPLTVMLGIRLEAPPRLARVFGFLGNISYPVYALHIPIMPIALVGLARLGLSNSAQLLAWIAILIFFGHLAERVDANVRRFLTTRLKRGEVVPQRTAVVAGST